LPFALPPSRDDYLGTHLCYASRGRSANTTVSACDECHLACKFQVTSQSRLVLLLLVVLPTARQIGPPVQAVGGVQFQRGSALIAPSERLFCSFCDLSYRGHYFKVLILFSLQRWDRTLIAQTLPAKALQVLQVCLVDQAALYSLHRRKRGGLCLSDLARK
jgi:hypothetical protein